MRPLAWNLSPQEFAKRLRDLRRLWKKRASGAANKRRVVDLVRKRRARYRKAGGHAELPAQHDNGSIEWTVAPADGVKVIILPQAETSSYVDRRRAARRLLWEAFPKNEAVALELISSRNADASSMKPPAVATARVGKRIVNRAVLLEALGAVICPQLTEREEERLRKAGAQVLDNELLSLEVSPPARPARATDAWHLQTMNVPGAWTTGLSGKGVLVGIADTGIEVSHPEFAGKKVYFRSFLENGRKPKNAKPRDFADHGTKVAALCAGETCGVAPGAHLAVAAIFTKQQDGKMRASRAQMLAGLNWLARGGQGLPRPVDVLNVSWGKETQTEGLYDVIQRHSLAGILTIAAIGNGGANGENRHHCPANFDIVLGVGATDRAGATCKFSAWGRVPNSQDGWKPEVVAPGEDIICAQPRSGDSKNSYTRDNGTSFASALVTGCAALVLEKNRDLRGNAPALKENLIKLTKGLDQNGTSKPDRKRGFGSLDLSGI